MKPAYKIALVAVSVCLALLGAVRLGSGDRKPPSPAPRERTTPERPQSPPPAKSTLHPSPSRAKINARATSSLPFWRDPSALPAARSRELIDRIVVLLRERKERTEHGSPDHQRLQFRQERLQRRLSSLGAKPPN